MEEAVEVLRSERERLQRLLILTGGGWPRLRTTRLDRAQAPTRVDSAEASTRVERADTAAERDLSDRERTVLRDPEVRKNVEILAAHISDAIDLHRRRPLPEAAARRLGELVVEPRRALGLETLLDTRRAVEVLLLECSDLPLLAQRTAAEYAEEEATLPTWRALYGTELPEVLADRPDPPSQAVQDATRARLQRLVAVRFWLYRPVRARRQLRITYLLYFGPVVVLAALLFGVAIGFQDEVEVRAVLLGAAAGAAGASLSGLLRFRDQVRLGAQVREFVPFYLAQVVVGVVFGLLVVLVSAAGWLNLETKAAGIGAVSFAAGFSEPFALGVVAKLSDRPSG